MPNMSEADMRHAIHMFSEGTLKDNKELYFPVMEFLCELADSACVEEPEIVHRVCSMIGFAVGRAYGIREEREGRASCSTS